MKDPTRPRKVYRVKGLKTSNNKNEGPDPIITSPVIWDSRESKIGGYTVVPHPDDYSFFPNLVSTTNQWYLC